MTWVTIPQILLREKRYVFWQGVTRTLWRKTGLKWISEDRNCGCTFDLHTYGDHVTVRELPPHKHLVPKKQFHQITLNYNLSARMLHTHWALTTSGWNLPWTHQGKEWLFNITLWRSMNKHMCLREGLMRKQDSNNGLGVTKIYIVSVCLFLCVCLLARRHQRTKFIYVWGLEAVVVDDEVRLRSWLKSDRIVLMMEINIWAFGAKENTKKRSWCCFWR